MQVRQTGPQRHTDLPKRQTFRLSLDFLSFHGCFHLLIAPTAIQFHPHPHHEQLGGLHSHSLIHDDDHIPMSTSFHAFGSCIFLYCSQWCSCSEWSKRAQEGKEVGQWLWGRSLLFNVPSPQPWHAKTEYACSWICPTPFLLCWYPKLVVFHSFLVLAQKWVCYLSVWSSRLQEQEGQYHHQREWYLKQHRTAFCSIRTSASAEA